MRSCGIAEDVLRWFRNYFNGTQEVKIGNVVSDCKSISTGIGQGTILGSLIFVFYIDDVIECIPHLRVNMYADYCLIYTIGNSWECMVPEIKAGLNSFQEWCINNNMKLNVKKSKSLVIGSSYKLANLNVINRFVLNHTFLDHVQSYNYLGVILDMHTILNPLLKKVKKVVSCKICSLAKIRNSITLNCALAIYKQTILLLIDYTGFMQMSVNISDKSEFQVMQNNALRICYNVRLRDKVSIERMHNEAKLLSLDQRRQKQVLLLLFIYKNRHLAVRRVHARNTRAANVYSFVYEKYQNVKYKNSPYYKGSLLWDTLPVETRQCLNIIDFRNSLKRIYRSYNSIIY